MTSPADLIPVPDEAVALGSAFAAGGHQLHLVGGTVRDALMGRPDDDLDFATDARPADVLKIVSSLTQATWTTGIEFGTIGAQINGRMCEITTFRADRYDGVSRNPEVVYGETLQDDLRRR
ncbi:MAG: poly(A) polymerase, partial [Pseudonocardiales bacterium]|nr:poly(A) polymerase [Pseudonocardiales bacterium]